MTAYKLSYFDMPSSRGEECRLALVLAGLEFEDDRIAYSDWSERKNGMPFHAVPVLTVEGKGELCHSNAILNYIGSRHGLRPTDAWAAARHDGVMDSAEEMRVKIWNVLRQGATDEEKKTFRTALSESILPQWALCLEAYIEGPFVSGPRIQVADLKIWALYQWLSGGIIDHVPTDVLAPFEKLTFIHRGVASDPKVAAFRAKHAK